MAHSTYILSMCTECMYVCVYVCVHVSAYAVYSHAYVYVWCVCVCVHAYVCVMHVKYNRHVEASCGEEETQIYSEKSLVSGSNKREGGEERKEKKVKEWMKERNREKNVKLQ